MPDFNQIDTILLDMDGTLLDLNFDNEFWLNHVPLRYSEKNHIELAQAQTHLFGLYQKVKGKLAWYSSDYWQETLDLPISELEQELKHLIKMRPDTVPFLTALKQAQKQLILVTNAHPKSLKLKLACTGLAPYLDKIYSTHQFGYPKEYPQLWAALAQELNYDATRTLFIDDGEHLLAMAKQCGIGHLLGVENPDSQAKVNLMTQFEGIQDFNTLLPL